MIIESTARVIVPVTITDAMLVSCTVAEPDTGETLWNAGTNYGIGAVAGRTTTHTLYENLLGGVDSTPPEDATGGLTPRWLAIAPTNRWAQFDRKIGTATTAATDLTTVVKPGGVDGLSLLDVIGLRADVTAVDRSGGSEIFNRSVSLDGTIVESVYDWMFNDFVQKRNVLLTDLPAQYPFMEVSVTIHSTSGAAVGVFVVGRVHDIGATKVDAGASIIDYGRVADDGFGNRDWLEGAWASKVTLPLIGNTSDFNRIYRLLAGLRSTPAVYIGSAKDAMAPLVVYGVYRDFYITVPDYPTISMNLEIEGLSNA